MMFEWFQDEVARVTTPKFHLVDGPVSDEFRQMIESSTIGLPPSYMCFVIQFGNAKLYRQGGVYLVQVYAGPREEESEKGEALIHFGRTDYGLAYFKESLLVKGEESPVFEWAGPDAGMRRAAGGFEEWLTKKCNAARRQFTKKAWAGILKGPKPFTEQEKAVVEARRRFRWRVIGIAKNGDYQFEVHNGSTMLLPYLSIGVRTRDGEPFGGVWLPVGHIGPGDTAIVEKDCYKEAFDPHDVEVFEEPDPGPEDRAEYWEFKALRRSSES